jgi:RNase adaptor protein for sRNA GlmZ degradation
LLFLVSGSSGSGKSAVGRILVERMEGLALLDFDDVPRPAQPTPERWAELLEQLLQRAVKLQADGRDSLLLGWTPLGQLLASPASRELDGVAACLLDCDDETRRERLERRTAEGWPAPTPAQVEEFMDFARWLRDDYAGRDALVVETSNLTVEEVADRLDDWIRASSGS